MVKLGITLIMMGWLGLAGSVAWILCFDDSGLGGYLPFVTLAILNPIAGIVLWEATRSTE